MANIPTTVTPGKDWTDGDIATAAALDAAANPTVEVPNATDEQAVDDANDAVVMTPHDVAVALAAAETARQFTVETTNAASFPIVAGNRVVRFGDTHTTTSAFPVPADNAGTFLYLRKHKSTYTWTITGHIENNPSYSHTYLTTDGTGYPAFYCNGTTWWQIGV